MALAYLFVDMNAYFASVEQQDRPELRGRPVIVVPVLAETTCAIAASYEARPFGIKTGTRVSDARKLCPHVCVVEARPRLYIETHHRILRAVETCIPVHTVRSIDELDCKLLGDERRPDRAVRIAGEIKQAVRRDAGESLRCSIGVAPNQFLAKVASDMQKPDGLTVIEDRDLPGRLHELELQDLPGIARRMEDRLHRVGVTTVEQLCRVPAETLGRAWGSQWLGRLWWHRLRGHDIPDAPTRRRTLGHSHVLPPAWRTEEGARAVMLRLLEKAAGRLRFIGYEAGALHVSAQFWGGPSWSRYVKMPRCQDTLTLIRAAARLWDAKPPAIPLKVGVLLTDLAAVGNVTGSLFPEDQNSLALSRAVDAINQRYGMHTVFFGGMYAARGRAPTRIAFTQIPDLKFADA